MNKNKYIIASVLGVSFIVIVIAFITLSSSSSSASNNTQTTSTTIVNSSNNSSTPTSSNFKDGSYTQSTDYRVRGHMESIKVTLTLKNNIVTDVQNQESGNDPESAQYQDAFESNYKDAVVGKSIDSINLSRVSGASDTTDAFMQTVQKIESQAKI